MIHRFLGYLAVVAVAVGIGWSLAATRDAALAGPRLARFQLLVVALLIVAAAAGVGVLISGGKPGDGLHFLYGAIAVGVVPLTRSFVPAADRRAGIATVAAFVVLGFVLYRLFVTG